MRFHKFFLHYLKLSIELACINLFNSTILPAMLYTQVKHGLPQKGITATSYDTQVYGKMYVGNIEIAEYQHIASFTDNKTDLYRMWPLGRPPQWWEDEIVQQFRPKERSLVWFVLWYINHYRSFNAKSIFTHIHSSISNNSV